MNPRGLSQTQGIDYNETFASMDVLTAFLDGDVEEDIYVIQPLGLDDGSGRVCKLQKALYGLKRAPRIWSKKIEKFMRKYGYWSFNSDRGVYSRPDRDVIIVILS